LQVNAEKDKTLGLAFEVIGGLQDQLCDMEVTARGVIVGLEGQVTQAEGVAAWWENRALVLEQMGLEALRRPALPSQTLCPSCCKQTLSCPWAWYAG